jgi:hypothetical protein
MEEQIQQPIEKKNIKWGLAFIFLVLIVGGVFAYQLFLNDNSKVSETNIKEIKKFNAITTGDTKEEIIIIQTNSPSSYKLDDIFKKGTQEPKCQGSVCEFEFYIKNPLARDISLDQNKLKLWYIKMENTANINSFKYFQEFQVNKTKKIITTPETCNNVILGQHGNGTDIIEYQCIPAEFISEDYSEIEWKEVNLQSITLNANAINKFKVRAVFNPTLAENSIDWKIAFDEIDIGYLEPDWILFNVTKTHYRNITFTNVLSNTTDWAVVHISLNETASATIGFPYSVANNGNNYSIGYITEPIRNLQLVGGAFTSSNSEVPFYIYNQSVGTENWSREYPTTVANVSFRVDGGDATDYHIGNKFIDLRIDNTDGGVATVTEWRATSAGNITCSSITNTNCMGVYNDVGAFLFGYTQTDVVCALNESNSLFKTYACVGRSGNLDWLNYTVYTGLPFIDITYRVTSTSLTTTFGSNVYYGNAGGVFVNNEEYYYFDGVNRTASFSTTAGNFRTNISSQVINGSGTIFLADYWLFKSNLGVGGDYDHQFKDTIYIGGVGGSGVIPDGAVVKYRYGIGGAGDFPNNDAGVRAKQLANSYYNPPIITISPQFSTAGGANSAPSFTTGYPQINSTDGSNTTIKNLTVIWIGTDVDPNNILKYNITWFTNNLTNFSLKNIAYTNGTLKVDLLKSVRNLTGSVGKTWKAQIDLCDNSSACVYANTSELLILATTPTTPVLNLPIDGFYTSNYTINISAYGSQDPETQATGLNYEFYLEREVNPPTILYGNKTIQSNITTLGQDGTYYWRVRTNNNASVSSYTSVKSFIVDRRFINYNLTRINSSVIYSSIQAFDLNITFNKSTAFDVNADFIFDGTNYNPTEITYGDSGRLWYYSLPITSTSLKNWNWNLTITQINSTIVYNTSFSGATNVVDTNFALCNTSLTTPLFLNITFQDEITNARINVTIDSSTFNFFVDDETYKKSYSFVNNTLNYEYDFCGVPDYAYLNVNITGLIYKQGTTYPARTYNDNLLLTNGTYNKTLYLLPSSAGSYVTFQVVDASSSPIQDVYVTVERPIGTTIEAKNTDAAGGVTFFLNPNLAYTFTFTRTGYTTYSTTLSPTQSTYTITLGILSTIPSISMNRGITYTITPSNRTLANDTTYTFGFDISSTYYPLSQYGFILFNTSNFNLGSASGTTATGSLVSTIINTGNQTQIIMNYFWVINSTYSNGTQSWFIFNKYQGKYSVLTICNDLKALSTRSEFGSPEAAKFTFALIAFLFILFAVAGISYYSHIYTPMAISIEALLFTSFFDFCAGFIPSVGNIPHFITVVIALITVTLIIDEVSNK